MESLPHELQEVLLFLERQHGVICDERLTLGNVVSTVFRATQGVQRLVVKIGLTEFALREVEKNIAGYDEMRAIGAQELLPNPLITTISYEGIPLILMEDCGLDFWHATQVAEHPVMLYEYLIGHMRGIYERTRRAAVDRQYLEPLRLRLLEQYRVHLLTLINEELIERLEKLKSETVAISTVCFSSFDFTPEDVFVTERGVKYLDPLPGILGMPAIDLACFAGVARDVYDLPGANEGYDFIYKFVESELPILLDCGVANARQHFLFGRALQCALSARFRMEHERERAALLAKQSETFLSQFLVELTG